MNGSRNGSSAPTPFFNQNVPPGGIPLASNSLKNPREFPPGPMGSNSGSLINGTQVQASYSVSNKFIQVFKIKLLKINLIFLVNI